MSSKRTWILASVLAMLFFSRLVWPTPWGYTAEYQETKTGGRARIDVRINRFTGSKQWNWGDGWQDHDVQID